MENSDFRYHAPADEAREEIDSGWDLWTFVRERGNDGYARDPSTKHRQTHVPPAGFLNHTVMGIPSMREVSMFAKLYSNSKLGGWMHEITAIPIRFPYARSLKRGQELEVQRWSHLEAQGFLRVTNFDTFPYEDPLLELARGGGRYLSTEHYGFSEFEQSDACVYYGN